jgi:hypothetical protein
MSKEIDLQEKYNVNAVIVTAIDWAANETNLSDFEIANIVRYFTTPYFHERWKKNFALCSSDAELKKELENEIINLIKETTDVKNKNLRTGYRCGCGAQKSNGIKEAIRPQQRISGRAQKVWGHFIAYLRRAAS